jgi:hypothetical protein
MGADGKMQFGCGVDCDGGGISIELNKDHKFTLVRLERIRIWRNNKPDDEGSTSQAASATRFSGWTGSNWTCASR